MKKLMFFAAVIMVTAFASSCSKSCVTCSGITVCESDYDPDDNGGVSWEDWREAALASGCTE